MYLLLQVLKSLISFEAQLIFLYSKPKEHLLLHKNELWLMNIAKGNDLETYRLHQIIQYSWREILKILFRPQLAEKFYFNEFWIKNYRLNVIIISRFHRMILEYDFQWN